MEAKKIALEELLWTCACGKPMATVFGYKVKHLNCVKCGRVASIEIKFKAAKKETTCKDCGAKTKPGKGSARCPSCWEDRCGHI